MRIAKNNVEENKIFYVQRVFATRVSVLGVIEEKITLTLIIPRQTSVNLKSRKCSSNLPATVPSQKREEALYVFRKP